MRRDSVQFQSPAGDRLAAKLDRPEREPRNFVLFAHCFSCSKDLKAVGRISESLVKQGFGVLRFDFTGLGESEGDFGATNFSSNLDDLVAAADWLRAEHGPPSILVGHSLGGAAVLAAAHRIPDAKAIATLGAPSTTQHLAESLLEANPELAREDSVEIKLAGRPFQIQRQMLEDLQEHTLEERVASLKRPLLVMHSPVDETVGIDHARKLYNAAKHPKSFISLDDADHLLLKSAADARYAADVLAAWAARYLPEAERAMASDPASELEDGEVEAVGTHERFTTQLRSGGHTWLADEPRRLGGKDLGPNPYDHLLAALGSCTAMTLRMYADRKKWPLDQVRVRLRHDRIHAADCEECEQQKGQIDRIQRTISLAGALDADQRTRLFEIAEKCPVHRTLQNTILIESSVG